MQTFQIESTRRAGPRQRTVEVDPRVGVELADGAKVTVTWPDGEAGPPMQAGGQQDRR